jgi:hypothetical protein
VPTLRQAAHRAAQRQAAHAREVPEVRAYEYTAEDRERWRAEIREAKATMTRKEFEEWLDRRLNSAG